MGNCKSESGAPLSSFFVFSLTLFVPRLTSRHFLQDLATPLAVSVTDSHPVFNTRKYPSLRVPSRFAPAKINGLSDVVDHPGIQNLNCGDNSLLLSSRNPERRNKGYNLPSATLTTQGVTARGVSPAKLCPATRCRPPTHLRAYRHCHR
ncbi:hypothetical protein B0H14DRAFT_1091241 [Mycena olivaceomarginata]|nr:hypothetical protein B0H14DRAFT_1091241 [Mycena olivaceomarginata]